MKVNFFKRALTAALALTLTVVAGSVSPSYAQPNLRNFLVGEWRSVVQTMVGTRDVVVMVLRPDGTFRTTIAVNGNFNDPAWQAGTWEIRSANQLVIHNQAWYPMRTVNPNGGAGAQTWNKLPVNIQRWQSFTVRVIDANHITSESGIVATRRQQERS